MRGGWVYGFLALPMLAFAVNPETLLMPGKLTAAHQKYEEQCTQCHDRSDRKRQTPLCLSCHKDVAADITAHTGFHGRLQNIETAQCKACHSEHVGRAADIVKLSREQFDHVTTDFALLGAHANVPCDACHKPGKRYREARSQCVACHQKDDVHAGALGADCASCHDASAWRHYQYDHGKTKFPLTGKHTEIPCAQCHFGNRYHDTPLACISCHAPDDVHRGARGIKCADCHSTGAWKNTKFDHAKETGFALLGVHSRIDCKGCHTSGNFQDKLPKDCVGCHRAQDAHAQRFGEKCEQCHDNEHWSPSTYDHTRDAHWPLEGAHAKADCHACHTESTATQKLAKDCGSCHRSDDVHKGKLGADCTQCHTPQGWLTDVEFDHDFTEFPLVGLHVAVPCEQCHKSREYRGADHDCFSCHQGDDVHQGGLGKDCARCHSANGWGIWEFDHGRETKFALTGAHGKLTCAGCHKQPADQVKLDSSCVSCHTQDDVHLGQYGRQCQRCHSTTTFKGARLH